MDEKIDTLLMMQVLRSRYSYRPSYLLDTLSSKYCATG